MCAFVCVLCDVWVHVCLCVCVCVCKDVILIRDIQVGCDNTLYGRCFEKIKRHVNLRSCMHACMYQVGLFF